MSQIYVVDLFCGCGGFSTGALLAGKIVILAIDNWSKALDVHKYNHPTTKHINMELGGDLEEMCMLIKSYIPEGEKIHLHGSPPCQNLSVANRVSGNEKEGMRLVNWYLDLVKLCKPHSWSMEQVIGARHHLSEGDFDQFHIINTQDYKVPQTRKRLFIGSGWTLPKKIGTLNLLDRLPYLENEKIYYVKGYSNTRSVRQNGVHIGNVKNTGRQGFRSIYEPTYTLCATGPLQFYDESLTKIRAITHREALQIQGFPDSYKIPEKMPSTHIYKMIGNAVSPIISKLINGG